MNGDGELVRTNDRRLGGFFVNVVPLKNFSRVKRIFVSRLVVQKRN